MSPPREQRSAEQLRNAYDLTLDALRRSYEQLEASATDFSPDMEAQAFASAWDSDDPVQRNRATGVLTNFERTYMLLLDLATLAVKLARRTGALQQDRDVSPIVALREAGVLSEKTERSLESQREVRNASQHIYIELSSRDAREAAKRQLEITPAIAGSIAKWIDSLDRQTTPGKDA